MQLATLNGPAVTMTSREIAELTGKRHDNVMPVCRELRDSGVCPEIQETPYISEQNGQTYTQCHLSKRDSYILVARLSPEFTARLVDRWQELEAQVPKFDPATLSRMDILKLAMESEQGRLEAVAERDHAIATKAQIGSKREATAMANVAKANREVARLMDRLGNNTRHATVKAVEKAAGKRFDWAPLRRWCTAHAVIAEDVPDPLYGSVKSWPADAWGEIYGIDLQELFATTQGA